MKHFVSENAKLISVAAVCLTVGLATPTMAASVVTDANNAHKVDGKHAVGAGASVAKRKGKLVATSGTTGRLPDNIIAKAPDANLLDGLDSTAFLRTSGKAADADKLDGLDSTAFLGVTGKAADADKLDGLDSTQFLKGVRMRTGPNFTIARNAFESGTASCQAGEQATGGGVYPVDNVFFPQVVASFPTPNASSFGTPNTDVVPTGWRVWVSNTDQGGFTTSTVTMAPYVLCAK